MQLLLRLFLSLVLFFLNGYSYTYAGTLRHVIRHSSLNSLHKSKPCGFYGLNDQASGITFQAPHTKKHKTIAIYEEDNENENVELSILKKNTESNNYFASFYALAPAGICYYIKPRLPLCSYRASILSDSYLILQVLRV